ncbi:hypothetical protein RVR_5165 [Actinacidiphila reveromycinica]|uniref:DUF397 domain-containing protein n=1 Tax=Actinacidiphila reveromycinica TaxID=659352 RepID=A0A7U3UTX8_9ACTN|nr:DUF397 domain-containing protein [Streptomyces sp. SN-593]BBA98822.1 hypothetical protein RVR_5165 [Streptomyces sp. SN-593]
MSRSAPDLSKAAWRKSSYSDGPDPNSCIEVADGFAGIVPVRDSKDPQGPALTFTADAWNAFVTSVRGNEFPTA